MQPTDRGMRLPIIATVKEAFVVAWQRRLALFRALLITSLVLAALDVVGDHFLKGLGSLSLVWLNVFLFWAVFTLFAVTCHRIVLLGETSVPRHGLLSWTSRETRFVGWSVVSSLYFAIVAAPFVIAIGVGLAMDTPFVKNYERYWIALAMVPTSYVVARLAVLFPATAVGERRNTDWAFETTAKNGWRVAVVTGFFPAAVEFVISALPIEHNLVMDFLLQLVENAFMAVGIIALSLSFRFLTSTAPETGGSQDPLLPMPEGNR